MNRIASAEHSLARLSSGINLAEHKRTVALMQRTNQLEIEMFKGASYWDCFKGTNLRRTEIASVSFISQVTNGGCLLYSPGQYTTRYTIVASLTLLTVYFFTSAGINANAAYGIALGGTGIAFICNCLSWLLIPFFGRRSICTSTS